MFIFQENVCIWCLITNSLIRWYRLYVELFWNYVKATTFRFPPILEHGKHIKLILIKYILNRIEDINNKTRNIYVPTKCSAYSNNTLNITIIIMGPDVASIFSRLGTVIIIAFSIQNTAFVSNDGAVSVRNERKISINYNFNLLLWKFRELTSKIGLETLLWYVIRICCL